MCTFLLYDESNYFYAVADQLSMYRKIKGHKPVGGVNNISFFKLLLTRKKRIFSVVYDTLNNFFKMAPCSF